jgi:hypothetical protein
MSEKTKANREEKRLQLKNKVLKDFEPIRIWKDKNTIEENLAKFRTKKEKLAALKSQINMAKEHVTITATNRNLKLQYLYSVFMEIFLFLLGVINKLLISCHCFFYYTFLIYCCFVI